MFVEVKSSMNPQFKKGILELCVLCCLLEGDKYGFELVSAVSGGVNMSEGTIYPLLKRLRDNRFVTTYLVESSEGPARKYYRLTPEGVAHAQQLRRDWYVFVRDIEKIIGTEEEAQG